ncbi:unnamed protein product [Rotaria magnacalcarata]|uniref:TTF-type domain-containing protein n=1 Tax=Rotaria magnacalcarata TaxID=392030 RepID=A0A816QF22_9BILA|nr:unnamed protein product [Rotaria magnacalcarata]
MVMPKMVVYGSFLTNILLKKLFCHICRDAFEHEIHPNKTKFNPTYRSFITDGVCDWKNSRTRFKYHESNLAVHDLTSECPTISNCILFAKDIIDFVSRSPKRLAILKEISNQLSMPYSNLTSLCPTRWTMRAESYNSLLNNYKLVQEALYTLIEEKGGPGIKTNGLHEQMNKFYFFFGLKLDDINFKLFYTKVLKESESLTDKPILARYRRPPKRY